MIRSFVVGTALLLLLSGCEQAYGVARTTMLQTPPEPACVQHAIEQTEGVVTVTYEAKHTRDLFGHTTTVYNFLYDGAVGSNVGGGLQLMEGGNGHFVYLNSILETNHTPPQRSIDATRPVMRAMERNIAARCGITELTVGVREDCTSVICNPLPN